MTNFLKQSTAATIKVGPFVDSTDGVTPETGLTIAQADIRLSKNGGAFAQTNNSAGATHDEFGWYGVPLDTTDTGSLGRLKVAIYESGALPAFTDFLVVPANVYDSLFSTDKLQVDSVEISGDSTAANNLELDYDGTGYAKSNSTIGTCTTNTDMVGTDNAALAATALTDVTWTDAKAAFLDASIQTVDTVADGIQADLSNGTDGLGALKALIDTVDGIVDSILVDTGELQTDWTNGGRLDLILDACALEATVGALNNLSAANVNSEVVDVLKTDTIAEMVAGAPPASPTMEEVLNYLYRLFRNKSLTTSSLITVRNDADTADLFKSTVSDDSTTFTRAEFVSG